jgi:DNA-binding Xre family transcriptional regulator
MTTKTVQVIEDPDNPEELLLDLGTELCAELGWKVGDTVQWIDNKDGTWQLIKLTGQPM